MSYFPNPHRAFVIPIILFFLWGRIDGHTFRHHIYNKPGSAGPALMDAQAKSMTETILSPLSQQLCSIILRSRFLFVLLSVLLSYTFYLTILYPLYLSPIRHVPGPPLFNIPPSTWNPLSYLLAPIKGQFSAILQGEAGIPQRDWFKKYGGEKGVVRVVGPIGIERLLFLSPEACEKVLVKESSDYPKPDFFRDLYGLVTGDGLLTVEKDEHRQMKKMVAPAFSVPNLTSQIHKYYEAIDNLIRIFTDQINSVKDPSEGVVLPIYKWGSKITLDIICATAFSYPTNSLNDPQNELANAYGRMTSLQCGIAHAWLIGFVGLMPKTTQRLRGEFGWRIRKLFRLLPGKLVLVEILIDSMHTIRRISRDILGQNIEESHTSDVERKKGLLSLLVRARKDSLEDESASHRLSDKAMIDQILTFLGAGHDTTTCGLTWTLYLLAANKVVQDKLRKEVTPILLQDAKPEYRKIKDLQWLDCVVMESLRVLPPLPMTFRRAGKTDHINGILVPEGTILYIPIRVINTWQAFWGLDAEEFRPERWLNISTGKDYHSQFSFMSFIVGPRACTGRTMAMMQMKTIIASLIANFEFDLAYQGQVPKPTAMFTMKPEDDMPLRIRLIEPKKNN